jgi:hypothetical protein
MVRLKLTLPNLYPSHRQLLTSRSLTLWTLLPRYIEWSPLMNVHRDMQNTETMQVMRGGQRGGWAGPGRSMVPCGDH